jgi:predicted enzyme related to lactoylglutathione lyase
MGERTAYAPGTFSWADVTTTDQEAAKAFYAGLFGWEPEDQPAGEGVSYTMMRLGGLDVAAVSPQPQMLRDAGAPPAWNSYVTVDSADATADRAARLGATVLSPAFDVMDVGRMAVLQDPQGASFMVWEPKASIGARLVNEPGALCWNELATPDPEAAAAFYGALFGWSIAPLADSPMPYLWATNGEADAAGLREPTPGEPNHWLVYLGTDDIVATADRAKELGGDPFAGVHTLGEDLSIAPVRDPQGAVFALYQGRFDD